MGEQCFIDGDYLVVRSEPEYSVKLDRCDTPEKILSWVYHLSEKTWVDTDLLGSFIRTAAEHIGCDIHCE